MNTDQLYDQVFYRYVLIMCPTIYSVGNHVNRRIEHNLYVDIINKIKSVVLDNIMNNITEQVFEPTISKGML